MLSATFTVSVSSSNPSISDFAFTSITGASTNQGSVAVANNVVTLTVATPVAGNIDVRFTVNYTETPAGGGAATNHSVIRTGTITIGSGWFTATSTTVPANNAAMTDRGIYRSGVSNTFTGAASNPAMYIALPTRAAGYSFRSGLAFVTATVITAGYTQAGYTLYSLGTIGTGETLNVEVQDG